MDIGGIGSLISLHHKHALTLKGAQSIDQLLQSSSASGDPGAMAEASASGSAEAPGKARLSSDVLGTLLEEQAQQTTGKPSGNQPATSSSAPAAPPSGNQAATASSVPSAPPTLQQIAGEFDLHHVTSQQEDQLQGQLVQAGVLTQQEGLRMFSMTTLANFFDAQHYRIVDGQMVATTPTQQGGLIGATPGGPTYDVIQQMQQALSADQYFGDTQNAAKDQDILAALDKLNELRSSAA